MHFGGYGQSYIIAISVSIGSMTKTKTGKNTAYNTFLHYLLKDAGPLFIAALSFALHTARFA